MTGTILAFGDARFSGPTGPGHRGSVVVGIAADEAGNNYWLVASDGGVFAHGNATYYGSGVGLCPQPVTALVPSGDGAGYRVVSANGTTTGFGDAGGPGSSTVAAKTVIGGRRNVMSVAHRPVGSSR